MPPISSDRRPVPTGRAAVLACLAAVSVVASGCTSSSSHEGHRGTSAASGPTSAASGTAAVSPVVVAAAAVAARTRDDVVLLHALGTATVSGGTLPARELPARGAAVASSLRAAVTDATRIPPAAGTPAAGLVGALRDYAALADQLAAWSPGGSGLPTAWFARIEQSDTSWRAALNALSAVSGRDLLAGLPHLSLPASP